MWLLTGFGSSLRGTWVLSKYGHWWCQERENMLKTIQDVGHSLFVTSLESGIPWLLLYSFHYKEPIIPPTPKGRGLCKGWRPGGKGFLGAVSEAAGRRETFPGYRYSISSFLTMSVEDGWYICSKKAKLSYCVICDVIGIAQEAMVVSWRHFNAGGTLLYTQIIDLRRCGIWSLFWSEE